MKKWIVLIVPVLLVGAGLAVWFYSNRESALVVQPDIPGLPPDPGEAGKRTLEGIDSDGDGVRDDIQRYIMIGQFDRPQVSLALTQLAKAQQTFVINHTADREVLKTINLTRRRANDCLECVTGLTEARDLAEQLKAEVLNTSERFRAYMEADAKVSGLSFDLSDSSSYSAACDE